MPQGPGDDILDAIEAGTADDQVMSKYKLNGDQLFAFKSLHYGLSNDKIVYEDISDYYPELESYFKRPAPLMPLGANTGPIQGANSVPGMAEPEPDIFKLVKDRVRLGKDLAASSNPSRSAKLYMGASALVKDEREQKRSEIATIDEQLKKAGYDPDEATKAIGDLPNLPGLTAKEALQMKEENKYFFDRKKSAIKSQYALIHAVDRKEGANAANKFIEQYQASQTAPDYQGQREATKAAVAAVYKYVDNTDEQRAIIKDIVRDKAYSYGLGMPGQEEAVLNDPRSQSMNPYQVIAMQFLEDVDPAKAQAYNRLLAFTPEEVSQLEKNSSFARGYESKSRDLENIGMNLMRNSLEEKLTAMLKTKENWSDSDKQNFAAVMERYKTLTKDYEEQNKRYPSVAAMDADRLMQDAMGSSTKGVAEKTVLGIGENVDDVINWVGDLIQAPFQTDKESALDDLQQLGDKDLAQLSQYDTEGQEMFGRKFKTVLTGDLKEKVDNIKSNPALSDDEQRDAVTSAILEDSNQNVKYVPNDKEGKMNFTAKTVLNSVSKVASEIVPQIAMTYFTGGGANASKLKELTALFSSTFATAYNDIYTDAIRKDIPNPAQYALVHTTIEAGTELLFNDLDKLKKMFGGKLAGKVLDGVTDESMKLLSKTGRFAKLKEAIQVTGKSSLKDSAQEALEEVTGQAAGNMADKKLFNQEVDVTDDVLQTGVTTFLGMLPLAGMGMPFRYKEISQMQKYALYEAATNPDKFLAKVEEDLKNNTITNSEAEARRETITKASKLARAMSAIRSDGSVMTDNEKTELLTNEVVADAVKEQVKNAPEETKEKLEKVSETLDKEKEKLLKPKKNASKRKTKTEAPAKTEGASVAIEAPATNSPADEGAANTNIQGTGTGEAAPAGELRWNDPENGREYILRGDDLYTTFQGGEARFTKKTKEVEDIINKIKRVNNAPGQESEFVDNDEDLDADTPPVEVLNKIKEEINIETEADVEQELNRIMGNSAPGFDELTTEPINNQSSDNTFNEYYKKANALITNLLPGLEVQVYENENEYYSKEKRPRGSLGYYDPQANKIAFNLAAINRHGRQRNVFHEVLHPIVNHAIGQNQEHLEDLYRSIEGLEGLPGLEDVWKHMNQYYQRGGKIQKIEAITQFLSLVADGKIDTSGLSENTITKIIDIINKILSALGINKQLSTASDIKRLSDSVIAAFHEQDVEPLKSTLGNRMQPVLNAEATDALSNQDQEDAIRELIKKTPASISSDRLKEMIVKATGITDQEAQDLVDEVRKPVIPTDQGRPLHHFTEAQKQVSVRKIDKALDAPTRNEPGWLHNFWEGVKNFSAWTDNPYRFITRMTEQINQAYGRVNNEAIPLGRQFEKSAAGRALLKVDSFIDEVIRGNIGDRNLGRLKGEKYKDFQRYLFSKRVMDRLYKQEEKQLAGEDANRQTGNVTRIDAEATIEAIKNKYGDIEDFVLRADALQRHMDTMLITLQDAGILSKESYDQIKADNDFYAPFSVVQSKLYADQDKQPVGINGVVKRIKGIDPKILKQQDPKNPFTLIDALRVIDALGDALNKEIITPEEYFSTALQILTDAKNEGKISEKEFNARVAELENPGFAVNDILNAAANMIYKAEGMALKNAMLQRLYAYKQYDREGLFIQDVDGFQAMTLPDGTTRMAPKPLNSIKVEPGMAPIKLRLGGKDIIVAVDKRAASKLTTMSNYETAAILKAANGLNSLFRAMVITLSPGFQVANFMIDFARTSMLSRYGPLAGKGWVQPMVNLMLYLPQFMEAFLHSGLGNLGYKTKTYKQWMQSDSFSKGMFDQLFDNERRIKEVNAPMAKRILMNFLKLKFIDVPGSILEQTHKLATHQRGMSVEGFKPEMFFAMLASTINRNIKPNMTSAELKEGMDRLNYEVQNFAGSPNFPQTHGWMKATSIFLQFFSARVKGEMTDYRRILNLVGKGEGVQLSKQDTIHIASQFTGALLMIMAYALRNNLDDEDEEEFNGISPFRRDNSLNIPLGYFEYEDEDGNKSKLRDYAQIPLRGLTATMNVMANSFFKYYKRQNPEEFKKSALAFMGNASPVNLHGGDEREISESLYSNLTPLFKYFVEYSFNRDTHNHRNIIPDFVQGRGMLSKFRNNDIDPWEVAIKNKTPQWAITMSKFLYDNLGIRASAIELDHMENTMGNPTELYHNAIKKRLFRSESNYPLYEPPNENKNTSSATVTPIISE